MLHLGCGGDHVVAYTEDGELWSWGRNEFGQLGHGDEGSDTNRSVPKKIESPTEFLEKKIVKICGGRNHTLAITQEGKLWSWGGGYDGHPVTGHGHNENIKLLFILLVDGILLNV